MADQCLPVGDKDRLWDLVEAAWAPLGPETGRARQALARRTPGPGVDLYARGFIVALGREFYDAVVRDPELAVLDGECEGQVRARGVRRGTPRSWSRTVTH